MIRAAFFSLFCHNLTVLFIESIQEDRIFGKILLNLRENIFGQGRAAGRQLLYRM